MILPDYVIGINASDDPTGGAARVAVDLKNGFTNRGNTYHLYSGVQRTQAPNVHLLKKPLWRNIASRLLANDSAYFASESIRYTEHYQKAHLIHAHNIHGWYFNIQTLANIAREKPVVWTLHDMWALTPHCAHTPITNTTNGFYTCQNLQDYPTLLWHNERALMAQKRAAYTVMSQHNLQLVVPSQWLADKVAGSVLSTLPCHVIPNGVDTTIFTPGSKAAARSTLQLPPDKKIVLFVANGGLTNIYKGGEHVRAVATYFEKDPSYLFVCLGNTTTETTGNLMRKPLIHDQALLALYYTAADVLLFPSSHENFPLVILEALACGLPPVAFKVGGVGAAFTHLEEGYQVEPGDTAGLIKGITHLTSLPAEQASKLSATTANRAATDYSLTNLVNRYHAVYTKAYTEHNQF